MYLHLLYFLNESHANNLYEQFPNNLPPGTRVVGMDRSHDPITPQKGLTIDEFSIPMRDGVEITLRRYCKSQTPNKLPLFIYMHGGGYVIGGLETDDSTCRAIALEIDVVVLSVEYRLAPEHIFPVGFEDSFEVVRWVSCTFMTRKGSLLASTNELPGRDF